MTTLLVTYDLGKPVQNYGDFYKVIKSYNWARLSESSYALTTTDRPSAIYEKLKPLMDGNDHLYVVQLNRPYQGFGPKDVNTWLERNL